MKNKSVDVVYTVASELGSIGMGTAALNALRGIEKSGLKYKAFSRGYKRNIPLNKKNLSNYSFLEYFSYPARFLNKKFGFNFNPFNFTFLYFVATNLAIDKFEVSYSPKSNSLIIWSNF